jgi:hypothetical protein
LRMLDKAEYIARKTINAGHGLNCA